MDVHRLCAPDVVRRFSLCVAPRILQIYPWGVSSKLEASTQGPGAERDAKEVSVVEAPGGKIYR